MSFARRLPRLARLLPAAAVVCLGTTAAAQDTTRAVRLGITVTGGTRPGVALLPVNGPLGDSVQAIIQRDFDFGDRINVIPLAPEAPDSAADTTRGQFNYPLYARLGAQVMVQATMTPFGVHVAVHNVAQQRVERVKEFALDENALSPGWRLSLHAVSDELESWITGTRGIAATRVLFSRDGRIWQVDSDGAGLTPLTSSGHAIAMSPAWHPDGTHIAYSLLDDDGTHIVIREMGGATRVLPTPRGVNSTPAFSPDGQTIVYAHGGENGTDLYATGAFSSGPARRITVGRGAADASKPTFNNDGRKIAYTSTRSGHPEVYISDADGTNATLLTPFRFGDQSYRSDPDWSPNGLLIAFQAQIEGRFQVFTIDPRDPSNMKRLTSEGANEMPSWAPDSRHLVLASTRAGVEQLFVLDVLSGRFRQLTHGSSRARFPSWSPLLRGR
jgi:TolB protein